MRHRTYVETEATAKRGWRIIDADGKVLGRMATRIADVLRGKDKPTFTPHMDAGDFVVVVNADKVVLTGSKPERKMYGYYTGYRGGLKKVTAGELKETNPEEMIRLAVWGMLPKGPLGQKIITKLKIFKGAAHDHAAQKPVPMDGAR